MRRFAIVAAIATLALACGLNEAVAQTAVGVGTGVGTGTATSNSGASASSGGGNPSIPFNNPASVQTRTRQPGSRAGSARRPVDSRAG